MTRRKMSQKQKDHRAYLRSAEWKKTKERYFKSKLIQVCYVCEKATGKLDLHHRTYERWGNERLTDLTPVHRTCHKKIHRLYSKNKKTMTIWEATTLARTNYRKK